MLTMANTEVNTAGTEEKMLSPSKEPTLALTSNDTSAPLNFSELTPCQFGISVQSFIPSSLNRKDASHLAKIKARRRSSVGVRGSPETNSLIRFMAQQRMKTPPTHQTAESQNVRSTPFLPRVTSTLRQKMASFQSLMDVEESEVCDPLPKQSTNGEGCIKTRDYLSDGNSLDRGKENDPPMITPSKRRCLGPPEGCEVEIREASAPILHFSLKEHEDDVFELQSPSQPLPDDPAAISPTKLGSPFRISSFPSLLEMEPKENDSTGTSTIKKKRVRFGGPLSPELFDKTLPPSTPLQKGGTPARAPTPGGALQLRSVLKTSQRSGSLTPETQQDLSSLSAFGASPTLVMSRNSRINSLGEDSEEKDRKIIFPSMEENDCAVMSGTEMWDSLPLNLNTAFHEESLSQIVTESEMKTSTTSQKDVLDDPVSLPDREMQHEAGVGTTAPVKSCKRRKKQPGPDCEPTSKAPARSGSRKRKQLEESEPVKRSTRSAAKSASGKMKATSTTTRRWNKDVDRSLYGSREYASKNPTLSPISERLPFISQSPAALQTPSTICTAVPNHEANNTQGRGDCTVTNALESPLEDSVTSAHCSKERTTANSRRLSGPKVRGRELKKRKVSVVDSDLLNEEPRDHTGGDAEEHCEDQTTTNETLLKHTQQQGGINIGPNDQTFADAPSTDSEKTSECYTSLSACPTSGDKLSYTSDLPAEPAQRQAKRGRRRSVKSSVLQEQRDEVEDHQMSCAVEEKGQGDQAASQHESRSSSDIQEDRGVANLQLAPWQADFNFEDVFKPVTTRGRCSVRRSLRNRSSAVYNSSSAGLAWMPRTSPDSRKEYRRRTSGRRLNAVLSVQPSLPEETQDKTC